MLSKIFYFLIAICLVDLIFLNYSFFTKNSLKITTPAPQPVSTTSSLDTRVSQLESSITAMQSATPVPTSSASPAPISTASRHVSYLPINGSFSQLSYNWVDVPTSSFYFDTGDYPGLISVNFEANMKLFNGNGLAFARLYDATHSAPIPGSQFQTGSQQDTMITSPPLTFLTGHNLIKVQIKSLTADTTYFNSARLIITSKY
jgi:hypothetical protein